MRLLALDMSLKTGWSLWEDGQYLDSGQLVQLHVKNFNVQLHPEKHPDYPFNLLPPVRLMVDQISGLILDKSVDFVVCENTVKGRNRNVQRILEFLHYELISEIVVLGYKKRFKYIDPSEWRKAVDLKLNNEQKKNNRDVSAGKKRGRVTKKHLAVNMVNNLKATSHLKLRVKDNDIADAVLLGMAFFILFPSS